MKPGDLVEKKFKDAFGGFVGVYLKDFAEDEYALRDCCIVFVLVSDDEFINPPFKERYTLKATLQPYISKETKGNKILFVEHQVMAIGLK